MALERERAELEALCAEHGGKLDPHEVVERARDPANPLHPYFQWDEGKAAEQYRLQQARSLIARVQITVLMPEPTVVRCFVSLPLDRRAGGYSQTVAVLADEQMRAQMLDDVLRRIAYWRGQAALFASPPVMSALSALEAAATAERTHKPGRGKQQRKTA